MCNQYDEHVLVWQRQYLFIFVRQDICAEQQAVQAAHATFKAGAMIGSNCKPDETHFVLIGVPDQNALYEVQGIASVNQIPSYAFHEPDIGGQLTAVAVGIVKQNNRAAFKQYGLLKFNRGGE